MGPIGPIGLTGRMEHKNWNLPRNVFLHILMIAALYAGVIALLTLLFQYVNVAFPDELWKGYTAILDRIRRAESVLLVVFPVYLFMSWVLERDFARDPEKRTFKIRKWLIYFTLFLSAVTIIVDLIFLIYNFLGGDLRIHFALKVVSVLAVAAAVFGYYLWELRRAADAPAALPRIAAIASAAAVLAVIVAGFLIVGSPATQRARRFDEQRVWDLQAIQSEVIGRWIRKEALPENLDALPSGATGFAAPLDPETRTPYEYRVTGPLAYELCAAFKTENPQPDPWSYHAPLSIMPHGEYPSRVPPPNDTWTHGMGRACFSRTIDPEFYKPEKPSL